MEIPEMETTAAIPPNESTPHDHRRFFGYTALVWLVSSGLFQKAAGWAGLAGSALVLALAAWAWLALRQRWDQWLIRVHPAGLWGGLGLALVLMFHFGYAWEDGKGPGRSSDRDEALNIAVARLSEGQTPYYPPHPDAGPLSLLPGAVFLATPFALAGNSAWQNLFWVGLLTWLLVRSGQPHAETAGLLAWTFALCPSLLYEWISGGDMIANGIYLTIALHAYCIAWGRPSLRIGPAVAAALFLGLALASRINLLLLLPLVGAYAWRCGGFPRGVAGAGLAVGLAAILSVPFYLADPAGFTPLVAGNKLLRLQEDAPWAPDAIRWFSAVVAVAAGFALRFLPSANPARLLATLSCLVIATPMLAMVAIESIVAGSLTFSFLHPRYGILMLFLALWASGFRRDGWGGDACNPGKHRERA